MENLRFIIITGMSGAGKTQVVRTLEDMGYFCVDNLPPVLLPKIAELCSQSSEKVARVAVVVDVRGGQFFDALLQGLEEVEQAGFVYEILFLEASDETLIRRFKETRRRHPLSPQRRLSEGIDKERSHLQQIRGRATQIIDTTDLSTAQLRDKVQHLFMGEKQQERMSISVVSFGFKHGMPMDADMMFDVRFLPNPFYVEDLRRKSGETPEVVEYIKKWPVSRQFIEKLIGLIDFLIPNYIKEGKGQLVISIGCTGGMHRSVFIARVIYERLREHGYKVNLEHRDLDKNLDKMESNC